MAPLSPLARRMIGLLFAMLAVAACTGSNGEAEPDVETDAAALNDPPRRYSAEWLIDARAVELDEEVASPFIYREVVDDQIGMYLVESPNHLALQEPEEVLLCAAVSRVPLNPYCASSPRAEGSPHVLSYPIQVIRGDWEPSSLYDLASYREVSLVAASDPDAWVTQLTTATAGFPIECFLAVGETSAAATGFEICFTNDDLRLVASVDLQNDLVFEIDLLRYERTAIADDFETGLDDFVENRPELQEQLLDLYPEVPAPKPTPTAE